MPRRQKTFWDSLSKETKDWIAIFGLVVGLLIVVFVLQSPIIGAAIIGFLAIGGGTVYWKLKTGQWWFQTAPSTRKDESPISTTKQTNLQEERQPIGAPSLSSSPSITRPTEPIVSRTSASNPHIQSIMFKIQQFRPLQRVFDERQYQDMLFSFMNDQFRSLRREVPFPNKKYIDATIGNVGIELKFQPNESDMDRAYSQIESYLDHLQYVIVVVSRPRTPDAMRYLEMKLQRRQWLNSRVFVVETMV